MILGSFPQNVGQTVFNSVDIASNMVRDVLSSSVLLRPTPDFHHIATPTISGYLRQI